MEDRAESVFRPTGRSSRKAEPLRGPGQEPRQDHPRLCITATVRAAELVLVTVHLAWARCLSGCLSLGRGGRTGTHRLSAFTPFAVLLLCPQGARLQRASAWCGAGLTQQGAKQGPWRGEACSPCQKLRIGWAAGGCRCCHRGRGPLMPLRCLLGMASHLLDYGMGPRAMVSWGSLIRGF